MADVRVGQEDPVERAPFPRPAAEARIVDEVDLPGYRVPDSDQSSEVEQAVLEKMERDLPELLL